MSKLDLTALEKVSACAAEVMLAISGKHEEISKNDSTKMCSLWDDLNDVHAPPQVVKAMADELINLRKHNQMLRAQRITDRRRFANPTPENLLVLVRKDLTNEQ